jgi:hypothetical protein
MVQIILSQPFVNTDVKIRKIGGFIVDGIEINHNVGHIFIFGIFSGQWGPHIVSTLKAQ